MDLPRNLQSLDWKSHIDHGRNNTGGLPFIKSQQLSVQLAPRPAFGYGKSYIDHYMPFLSYVSACHNMA
jgi:hypothetical protein